MRLVEKDDAPCEGAPVSSRHETRE